MSAAVANEEGMEAATPTRTRGREGEGTGVRWSTATEESSCSNEKAGTNGRTDGRTEKKRKAGGKTQIIVQVVLKNAHIVE